MHCFYQENLYLSYILRLLNVALKLQALRFVSVMLLRLPIVGVQGIEACYEMAEVLCP